MPIDLVSTITKFADRNRFLLLGIIFSLLILAVPLGCQTKASSPFDGKQASDTQLIAQGEVYVAKMQAEMIKIEADQKRSVAAIEAQYRSGLASAGADAETALALNAADSQAKAAAMEAALNEIEQKKQAIQVGLETITQIGATAAGPQFGPMIMSAAGLASLVMGIGAKADSNRKDKVIAQLKGTDPKTVMT